jgi:hypothetical protein
LCQAPGCNDSVKNGGESDIDCGGTTSCPRCPNGKGCAAASDCSSTYCGTGTCSPPPVLQFPYTPVNFALTGLDPLSTDDMTLLDCGVSTFDSATLAFGNWCGQNQPSPVVQTQTGGPDVVVVPVRNLTLAGGSTIKLTGSRPVIFAVYGNATIAGTIDAGATGSTPGRAERQLRDEPGRRRLGRYGLIRRGERRRGRRPLPPAAKAAGRTQQGSSTSGIAGVVRGSAAQPAARGRGGGLAGACSGRLAVAA